MQIERAKVFFVPRVSQVVTEMLAACCESADEALLSEKAGRKEAGLAAERRNAPRQIFTRMGMAEYRRACYKQRCCYPVDALAGVDAYKRVSGGVSLDLVGASLTMSYAKRSRMVAGTKPAD